MGDGFKTKIILECFKYFRRKCRIYWSWGREGFYIRHTHTQTHISESKKKSVKSHNLITTLKKSNTCKWQMHAGAYVCIWQQITLNNKWQWREQENDRFCLGWWERSWSHLTVSNPAKQFPTSDGNVEFQPQAVMHWAWLDFWWWIPLV